MKSIILPMVLLTIGITSTANVKRSMSEYSINTIASTTNGMPALLNAYYAVKTSLVNDNANEAATNAAKLVNLLKGVTTDSLTAKDKKAFMTLQQKLLTDATAIAGTKDMDKQRAHFESLSDNFYALAKLVTMSDKPIYHEYCPMKKAHWLSSDKAINNPYYGSEMLTCGRVDDIIK